jgi:hypothetical protein
LKSYISDIRYREMCHIVFEEAVPLLLPSLSFCYLCLTDLSDRDRLLEICESSKTAVPESLLSVIYTLEDSTDRVQLFLGVVYVLTLESGFEPTLRADQAIEMTDGCEQSLTTAQTIAKLSVKQQMAFKYDSRKVSRWSKAGLPTSSSGNPRKWKFRTGGLGTLVLSIEFLISSNVALAIVSGLAQTNNSSKISKSADFCMQVLS